MKKNLTAKTVLGLFTTALLVSACSRPSERPSVVDSKAAANIFAMSAVAEITNEKSRTAYISGSENAALKTADGSVKQVKIEGKVQDLLKRVKNADTKKAMDDHLKTGAIAIVIMNDQVKILKIVPDTELTTNYDVLSMKYLARLKALSKTPSAKAQASVIQELTELKYTSPKSNNETFGMVEITSLKIDKFGVLDNNKNDYDEKLSILNVQDRPFEISTHILIGDEISSETGEKLPAAE